MLATPLMYLAVAIGAFGPAVPVGSLIGAAGALP